MPKRLLQFSIKQLDAKGMHVGTRLLAIDPACIMAVLDVTNYIDENLPKMADIVLYTGLTYRVDASYHQVFMEWYNAHTEKKFEEPKVYEKAKDN